MTQTDFELPILKLQLMGALGEFQYFLLLALEIILQFADNDAHLAFLDQMIQSEKKQRDAGRENQDKRERDIFCQGEEMERNRRGIGSHEKREPHTDQHDQNKYFHTKKEGGIASRSIPPSLFRR